MYVFSSQGLSGVCETTNLIYWFKASSTNGMGLNFLHLPIMHEWATRASDFQELLVIINGLRIFELKAKAQLRNMLFI